MPGIEPEEAGPTVSVIVPNYNHARYLRKRIDSILAQTYQDFELILLDDCSTDDSREILALYAGHARIQTEFNEINSGSTFKQWNRGVRRARGRLVWIAESDDYAEPNFLERTVSVLQAHPKATFAYCRSYRVGMDGERLEFADGYLNCLDGRHWKANFIVDGLEEVGRFFTLTNPVPNASAVLFRKAAYEQAGYAEERLRVCGDYRIWAAMAMAGEIAYVAEPLNYFRSHSQNVRTSSQTGALDVFEYYQTMLEMVKLVASPGLNLENRASELLRLNPSDLNAAERIDASRLALSFIEEWNLRHNRYLGRDIVVSHFRNLHCVLGFQEFSVRPPGRWRFFLQRCRFYRQIFPEMTWRAKLVNLLKVIGSPLIGYRHRHWPQQVYARALRK